MNSFYGILGASGCRFHDSRLASSITRPRARDHPAHPRHHRAGRRLGDLRRHRLPVRPARRGRGGGGGASARRRDSADAQRVVASYHRARTPSRIVPRNRVRDAFPQVPHADGARQRDRQQEAIRRHGAHRRAWPRPRNSRVSRAYARTGRHSHARSSASSTGAVFMGEPFEGFVRGTLEAMLAGEHDEALVYRKRLRPERRGVYPQRPAPRAGRAQARPQGALGPLRHHHVGTRTGRRRADRRPAPTTTTTGTDSSRPRRTASSTFWTRASTRSRTGRSPSSEHRAA